MPLAWLQDLLDALLEPDHLDLHIRFDHALTTTIPRLEGIIRDSLAANDHDRIAKIVHQLCHDYAYAVHQPHARNGGLIGLAAAAIALGGVRWPSSHTIIILLLIILTGRRSLSTRNRSSSSRLLLRSRCPCAILCL